MQSFHPRMCVRDIDASRPFAPLYAGVFLRPQAIRGVPPLDVADAPPSCQAMVAHGARGRCGAGPMEDRSAVTNVVAHRLRTYTGVFRVTSTFAIAAWDSSLVPRQRGARLHLRAQRAVVRGESGWREGSRSASLHVHSVAEAEHAGHLGIHQAIWEQTYPSTICSRS